MPPEEQEQGLGQGSHAYLFPVYQHIHAFRQFQTLSRSYFLQYIITFAVIRQQASQTLQQHLGIAYLVLQLYDLVSVFHRPFFQSAVPLLQQGQEQGFHSHFFHKP